MADNKLIIPAIKDCASNMACNEFNLVNIKTTTADTDAYRSSLANNKFTTAAMDDKESNKVEK